MKHVACLAAAALLFQPGPAQAAGEPPALAPVSDWSVASAGERCSLTRDFGDGRQQARLQIDTYGSRSGYRVLVAGSAVPRVTAGVTQIRVGYSPDTQERERLTATAGTSGQAQAVWFNRAFLPDPRSLAAELAAPDAFRERALELERANAAFAHSVAHLTIGFGSRKTLRLETGAMAEPFALLDACVDRLVAGWGVDPARHRARSRPARPAVAAALVPPASQSAAQRRTARIAQTASQAGNVIPVRFMIDATGQATACVFQSGPADPALVQAICGNFAAPRYEPALDAEGRPIASFIQIEVVPPPRR